MLQETLEAFFANSQGEECIFTWRAIGGGLVTLLPAMTYTLRVNPQNPYLMGNKDCVVMQPSLRTPCMCKAWS